MNVIYGLCSADVMHRGHILVQERNMFDIAHLSGSRTGVRPFFTPSMFLEIFNIVIVRVTLSLISSILFDLG
jgi:hypothetical protein